ncbi:MAG: hypothetical protein D6698_08465 [Gammaproteobacteria bacterium]|nr:MAG: hypothetical protein D6698_08465 [Gammaproteobacteria bacterium]
MKNTNILIIAAAIALFSILLYRACKQTQPCIKVVEKTVDTLYIEKPDTGWHSPDLVPVDSLIKYDSETNEKVRFWKEKYKDLISHVILSDSLNESCEQRITFLEARVAALTSQLQTGDSIITSLAMQLDEATQLKKYAGIDSTENYVHAFTILSPYIPPGGYKYRTDVKQKVVTIRETETRYFTRPNSVSILTGIGERQGVLYGVGYDRNYARVGVSTVALYNDKTETISIAAGLKLNF